MARSTTEISSSFSLFECDVSAGDLENIPSEDAISAFLFGRLPAGRNSSGWKWSAHYPEGMTAGPLHPEKESKFTGLDEGKLAIS